jgi:hypothetical protein
MKRNMFTRPEVDAVARNMVLVELYTDGTDAASEANQKLEEEKFQTVAIPFYVVYDGNQKALATFADKTGDSQQYLAFLNARPADAAPAFDGARRFRNSIACRRIWGRRAWRWWGFPWMRTEPKR